MRRILAAVLTAVSLASAVQATTFTIDPYHSSVTFKVKHVVGKVAGHFDKFTGTFDFVPGDAKAWKAQAAIDTASVNTGIEKRDNHLRTPDFFDVQKYPTMTFKSTGVTDVQDNKAKLHGDLTLHGVTLPVTLDLELAGVAKDPMGKGERAGATATGKINRNDFKVGPSGGPMAGMVGSEVEISIEIEGVSQ